MTNNPTPERGERTLPIEKARRMYWQPDAFFKKILRNRKVWTRKDRCVAYGELVRRRNARVGK